VLFKNIFLSVIYIIESTHEPNDLNYINSSSAHLINEHNFQLIGSFGDHEPSSMNQTIYSSSSARLINGLNFQLIGSFGDHEPSSTNKTIYSSSSVHLINELNFQLKFSLFNL
jgi:hypothetical protein